jgi:hypothetical protein
MTIRTETTVFKLFASMYLAALAIRPLPSLAATRTIDLQDDGGDPHLTIRLYSSVKSLSLFTLSAAEAEAERILRTAYLTLTWVNCPSGKNPTLCAAPTQTTDLILHVLPTASSRTTANALGMAMWSPHGSSAVLFYDRIVAYRTHQTFPSHILGVAIAHEIVHLLLPGASHTDLGLMRAKWYTEDLKVENSTRLTLSGQSARLIHKSLRSMNPAKETADK